MYERDAMDFVKEQAEDAVEYDVRMWKISIDIQDGENEYIDEAFFYGTRIDATRYAESYMDGYFGTIAPSWDDHDMCWYAENEERSAVYDLWPYESVTAMSVRGALNFKMDFHLN